MNYDSGVLNTDPQLSSRRSDANLGCAEKSWRVVAATSTSLVTDKKTPTVIHRP